MAEFVEGWLVAQVLGEGAYGEVRLLVHARSGAAVALKVARGGGEGAREAALHRALRHPHVLRCLGERTHLRHHYMFLEYAQGGELFDKIEPDVGMPESAARRYWRQTLAGLEYLHSRGVAHRDIKPENLLLDHHDDIKISDFGMATVFRHGARERTLSRVCGTLPYAAPEVLAAPARPYRAPPADLWAAALVLLAMLAGERRWRSQPADGAGAGGGGEGAGVPELSDADMDALLTRSQPACDSDAALTCPASAAAALLVRRATRVWVRADERAALQALCEALAARGHTWRRLHPRLLAVHCGEVRMRAWALARGERLSLLEFRRSRGCGLQFKRRFLELRAALAPLATSPPPHAELFAEPLAEPLLAADAQFYVKNVNA